MIIANWKMNGSKVLIKDWIASVSMELEVNKTKNCIFCPPTCYLDYAKSLSATTIITLAEKGSLIVNNNEVIEIPAIVVDKVIDTTGAGDLFASGFLYGLCQNKDLKTCGHMASVAASEIISHYGARPLTKLSTLI